MFFLAAELLCLLVHSDTFVLLVAVVVIAVVVIIEKLPIIWKTLLEEVKGACPGQIGNELESMLIVYE